MKVLAGACVAMAVMSLAVVIPKVEPAGAENDNLVIALNLFPTPTKTPTRTPTPAGTPPTKTPTKTPTTRPSPLPTATTASPHY